MLRHNNCRSTAINIGAIWGAYFLHGASLAIKNHGGITMAPVQKIYLRRIEREDVGLLWQWSKNEELAFFNAFTSNKTKAEFEKDYDSSVGSSSTMDYLIVQSDDESPIGFCGLKDISWIDRHGEIFISICDKKARKAGIATIAVLILTKIAFYELNLNKIYAKIASHNKRMMNMMSEWGFVHEGTLREMHYANNKYFDVVVYGILKSEAQLLMETAISKVAKHLFPGCSDEVINSIKEEVNRIMGNGDAPVGVLTGVM